MQIFSESWSAHQLCRQIYDERKNVAWKLEATQTKINLEFRSHEPRGWIDWKFFPHFFLFIFPLRLIESYVSFRIKKLGPILTCSGGYYPITWPEWAWYWSNGLHCKLESRETGSFLDIWYNDNGVDIVRWIMEVRECTIIKELFKQL